MDEGRKIHSELNSDKQVGEQKNPDENPDENPIRIGEVREDEEIGRILDQAVALVTYLLVFTICFTR